MKPKKITFRETQKIDLETKLIHKFPLPTKSMSISYMVVNGRHPQGNNNFAIENDCTFVIYITKGNGIIYAGEEKFAVEIGDVIFVPNGNKFAVEGKLEYVTIDTPSWYPEQSKEIKNC
ncbi:MAG: hypothetical protein KAQ92_05590 [Candidatus Aenigmarchaeota archaeon]|nr:hypothetical protein [Candidatus Aenigmarchaeota archaeon]